MQSPIIQAKYDELDDIAKLFANCFSDSEALYRAVNSRYEPLASGGWQGKGSQAFIATMSSDVLPALVRLQEALSEAQATTMQISALMQQAEEVASAPFQGGVEVFGANGGGGSGEGIGNGAGGGAIGSGAISSSSLNFSMSASVDMGKLGEMLMGNDGIHTALDILSFVPYVGTVAGIANGVLHLAKKNYGDAAISFATAVPFSRALSAASKLIRNTDKVSDGWKLVDKVQNLVSAGDFGKKLLDNDVVNFKAGVQYERSNIIYSTDSQGRVGSIGGPLTLGLPQANSGILPQPSVPQTSPQSFPLSNTQRNVLLQEKQSLDAGISLGSKPSAHLNIRSSFQKDTHVGAYEFTTSDSHNLPRTRILQGR